MFQPASDVLAPWAAEPNRMASYAPGERASVNWKNRGQYYPAVIAARVGGAVQVQYDADGSTEWTVAPARRPMLMSLDTAHDSIVDKAAWMRARVMARSLNSTPCARQPSGG